MYTYGTHVCTWSPGERSPDWSGQDPGPDGLVSVHQRLGAQSTAPEEGRLQSRVAAAGEQRGHCRGSVSVRSASARGWCVQRSRVQGNVVKRNGRMHDPQGPVGDAITIEWVRYFEMIYSGAKELIVSGCHLRSNTCSCQESTIRCAYVIMSVLSLPRRHLVAPCTHAATSNPRPRTSTERQSHTGSRKRVVIQPSPHPAAGRQRPGGERSAGRPRGQHQRARSC
jgi:hypothetical protein